MNLKENFNQLKKEAYAGLQKRSDSWLWIGMLEAVPYFLGDRTKGELLLVVNTGMRLLDDIADGDRAVPDGKTRVGYLEKKQQFIRKPKDPQDELDYLFTYGYQLADKAELSITNELDAFFKYFLFDAKRLGTHQIFPQAELNEAYDSCDITGTIRGSLMIFGDNPDKANLLMPLGRAVRKHYTLRDYDADICAGFVNISREDMERHGISPDNLSNRNHPRIASWFKEEAKTGLEMLAEHHSIMRSADFKLRGRLALPFAYTKPAERFFNSVLNETEFSG